MEFENLTSSGGAMEHHCPALNNKIEHTLNFKSVYFEVLMPSPRSRMAAWPHGRK